MRIGKAKRQTTSDGRDIQQQTDDIQKELNAEGLSRRAFLDRLTVLGVGFGAAYVLGVKSAEAGARADEVVSLGSTNPALNGIIEEGRQVLDPGPAEGGDPQLQTAQWSGYGGTPGGGSGGGYGGGGGGGGQGGESSYSRGAPYSRAQYSRGYARSYERYARAEYQRYARSYERYARAVYERYARRYERFARPPYERYARGYDRVY